jgi:hypothetical protein
MLPIEVDAARTTPSSQLSIRKPLVDREQKREDVHATLLQPSMGFPNLMEWPSKEKGKHDMVSLSAFGEANMT